MANASNSLGRLLRLVLLIVAAVFYGLHFTHLTADFPNNSPWMDWAKYTDEGWYGDAAIRHYLLGHWYVPGDFNPATALPVWPVLEAVVFRFTGVSVVAARALVVVVFGGTLLEAWWLLRRTTGAAWLSERGLTAGAAVTQWSPTVAVLLLAVSPFCFVFSRLAILEPPLVLLTLLALLTASCIRPMTRVPPLREAREGDAALTSTLRQVVDVSYLRLNLVPLLLLGVLLPTMILTKTTALFLMPAIAWMLLASVGYRMRAFLLTGTPVVAIAAVLWLAYFSLLARGQLLLDYRYLFSANAYTGITLATARTVIMTTISSGSWMDPVLYPLAICLAVLALLLSAVRWRRMRQEPLLIALILWAGGYGAFLAYHNNIQPRYYLVIAMPATLLVPLALERLVVPLFRAQTWRLGAAAVSMLVLVVIIVRDARQTIAYVRHPEYTLYDAARSIARYIAQDEQSDPAHSRLVLSISGSDLSLMTGLPSICDDFGTLELGDRVKLYQPGWYVAWNDIEDDKMDAMTPLYHVERVATFAAMDDPARNEMILYKLEDAAHTPPKPLHSPPVPRRLQTRVGQQPTASQLQH